MMGYVYTAHVWFDAEPIPPYEQPQAAEYRPPPIDWSLPEFDDALYDNDYGREPLASE